MEFAVRHFIPGRIRVHAPTLCVRRALAEAALAWLKKLPGVTGARINYDCHSLVVEYDRDNDAVVRELVGHMRAITVEELQAIVGLQAMPDEQAPEGQSAEAQVLPPGRAPLAVPTLSLGLAFSANPVVQAVNLPLMLWNAYPIALRAWRVWRRESRLNIDFLDVLAISASILQGNPMAGAVVTWLIKFGDWIRDLTAAGQRRAVADLLEFQAKSAWVIRDGSVVAIPAKSLLVGDSVVVYPGEMIPVDGEIIAGAAMIDQKAITGESLPVARGVGQSAFAATIVHEGQLTIRAIRVGVETTAGQIARLVDAAPLGDTRMQNHAELLADRLVLPTIALASGQAALTGDLNRFLSLVIVDYGTGIRVAAPTAVLSSMTEAARAGIIIKSGAHMERLCQVDTVVFDKTGTLSHGEPAVQDVIAYRDHLTPEHLVGLAAAAETKLKHPVAEALRAKARQLRVNVPECDETRYRLGLGVEGQVNGYYLHVGSERFLRASGVRLDRAAADRERYAERGLSCLHVAVDGEIAGLVAYADRIRAESGSVIARLAQLGLKESIMLTGDNETVALAVRRRLGLTRHMAEMLPADKVEAVRELRRKGKIVAMVGDGINDSPALAHADVGIAMRHGAEVTHESAHVVLMEDSLAKVVQAVEISRGAVSLIRQNYAIVAGLNTLALALALPSGFVSPVTTAIISNGSAVLASLNGVRPLLRLR
jgi:manganese/zinc-transporting P-type ATPase C